MKKILIIGSGIAGLSCAVTGAQQGMHVILVSPMPSERSQSVMAAGGINAVLYPEKEGDSVSSHVQDTLKGGCFLENEEDVEELCREAFRILNDLENMGAVFTRDENGKIAQRAFGGQSYRRTAFAGAATGKHIVSALIQKCRQYECQGKIERKMGLHFYSALIRNARCYGAVFLDGIGEKLEVIYADAVVMATGGQNTIFGKTTGSTLCDGYAVGKLFEQGAKLRNLEFIQYHPTTIETYQKRLLITEAARGEGGRLFYNKEGQRVYFMEEMFGPKGNLMPRDIVSRCMEECPSQVYLDVTFLGDALIHSRLEEVYELCKKYRNLDITKEVIPVAPSVHFFMGGLWVDSNHETNIHRLYAVGECASKYHGANRLGGNSLLAAMYSGRVAARDIGYAEKESDVGLRFDGEIEELEQQLKKIKESKSNFSAVIVRNDLAEMMKENLGIIRNADKINEGIETVDFYLKATDKILYDKDVSLYVSCSLKNILLLAKAILESALFRCESRGAHVRSDYPQTNPELSVSTIAEYKDGDVHIRYEAIPKSNRRYRSDSDKGDKKSDCTN